MSDSLDARRVDETNATGRPPVVFIHGLWLLASSWDRWAAAFEEAGYATLAPGWPDDPETVVEANARPEVFAGKGVGEVVDHFARLIGKLDRKPAVIGHSLGGLLTQILAGRGLSAVSVAIDPAPFRGVLPLPVSVLRVANPVLYTTFAVPAAGAPLFQAALANLNPRTEVQVDTASPDRGPLLIISGERDHAVPPSVDSGWRAVADIALDFVRRFHQ